MIWDYQVKGFLKEIGDILRQKEEEPAPVEDENGAKKKIRKKWGSARSKIDNFIFIFPRKICFSKNEADGSAQPRCALQRRGLASHREDKAHARPGA